MRFISQEGIDECLANRMYYKAKERLSKLDDDANPCVEDYEKMKYFTFEGFEKPSYAVDFINLNYQPEIFANDVC